MDGRYLIILYECTKYMLSVCDEGDLSQGMLERFNGFDFQVDSLRSSGLEAGDLGLRGDRIRCSDDVKKKSNSKENYDCQLVGYTGESDRNRNDPSIESRPLSFLSAS